MDKVKLLALIRLATALALCGLGVYVVVQLWRVV